MARRWRPTVPLTWPPLGEFIGADYINITGAELWHCVGCNLIEVVHNEHCLLYGRRVLLEIIPLTPMRLRELASDWFSIDRVRKALRI